MDTKQVRFQFTIAGLFYATLLAAVCIAMFTLPIPRGTEWLVPLRILSGFMLGGASIGSLFGYPVRGGMSGVIGFLIAATSAN